MEKNKPLYLPSELVIQILVRLPVKSLICFKCVCKSWFSLISDPNFANSHFQLTATHTHRILSISPFSLKTQSIDFESSLNHKSTSRNLNWLRRSSYLKIKGSCRGFLLLTASSKLYLWNPSTGFHRQIPASPFYSDTLLFNFNLLYGFGYEQSRDDYLLVSLSYDVNHASSQLEFFSLRDNTWKDIEGTGYPHYLDPKPVSLINGAIHWLAFRFDLMVHVIVVFDLMERKLLEIPTPDGFGHYDHYHKYIGLWVFGDFLSLWTKNDHIVEIWVMREYKVHSSWTKTLVFPTNAIPYFSPIYSTKNGDIIGTNGNTGLVKYNGKGQLLRQCSYRDDLGEPQVVMYTESLLSLPHFLETLNKFKKTTQTRRLRSKKKCKDTITSGIKKKKETMRSKWKRGAES
ncbi:F-box/kelch-repeat protein At3g23880-like [Trifolium pratense]|uniref:F-box/kelch-repeat protein At3g23880-like n=1 Tax=Trifolium pratense TaxID=57577 RepID=UPI001E690707|nr:F-box/kelch-repeat protein At3g23880-like [Trifolium pratense]